MAVQVYSDCLRRRYYASRLSWAYVFFVVSGATLLTLPFFLAYSSTFWLKTKTYREQPKVDYEYKMLGVLQGLDGSGEAMQIYFSSLSTVASLFESELRVPSVRSIDVDKNRDGQTDRFQLEALVPLEKGERILSVSVVLFFDVRLRRKARLRMETAAFVSGSSPLFGRGLYVDGDYTFRQQWPLRVTGGYRLPYEAFPLLDAKNPDLQQALFTNLLSTYRARNLTMDLTNTYQVWSPLLGNNQDYRFNFSLNVRVPLADVLYTPKATEVLQDAWIKYLSIFVVVYLLLDRLLSFVFFFQLLPTTTTIDTTDTSSRK